MPKSTLQCSQTCGEPLPTYTSTGDPPTLAGNFVSVSCEVTAPLLRVLVHAKFCLCPTGLESLFTLVLWKTYNQILLGFKARFPALCLCLTWRSESSQQCKNFFGIIVLQSVGHLPDGYEILFCCDCAPPTVLLGLLLCLWMWDIFLWWVPLAWKIPWTEEPGSLQSMGLLRVGHD